MMPPCLGDLGHSPTGAHVRRYFLGNCCSVITTNKWYEDLKEFPAGGQKWLEGNMVVFDVEPSRWEHPCPLEDCRKALNVVQI